MKRNPRQSGFGAIEVMIAAGVVGIIMAGIVSLSTISFRQQSQAVLAVNLLATKNNLVALLNSAGSWQKTLELAANRGIPTAPNLECLRNSTPCTANGVDKPTGVPIVDKKIARIADVSGAVAYDNTPTSGFTTQGAPCTGFIAPPAVGNDACPIHFDITWTAICGTSCIGPQTAITVRAVYNPAKNRSLVNTDNYTQTFIRGATAGPSVPSGTWCGFKIGNMACGTNGWGPLTVSYPKNVFCAGVTVATWSGSCVYSGDSDTGYIPVGTWTASCPAGYSLHALWSANILTCLKD